MANAEAFNNNHLAGKEPPGMRGGLPLLGHIIPFARNPFLFMKRVSDTLGEIAQFRIFNQRMILLTGDDASKLFYRSSDEQLDQSAAYKLMTPIFGEGIVFDAPIDRKNQQLRMLMPALRGEAMRNHADKILMEIEDLSQQWGDEGEVDLVAAMKQLTINTASHCLLGKEFRYELTDEFAAIYHDLEKGVNALAYSFPNLPLPSFRKRDQARRKLHELVKGIVQKRERQTDKPTDMFQMLIDTHYDDGSKLSSDEITGILVAAIFAGHHTSSGTAAWVLLELLKHPQILQEVREELDTLFGADGEVTFQRLREVPKLENTLKEVLRLHPPLIVLMRQVTEDMPFKDYVIRAGDMVWASPPVTHRMQHLFTNPEQFDPDRYAEARAEDKNLMAYQPFGGGKHKCSGNAFAMFQIKAIFAVLLRRYDFELVNPPDTYVDDYGEMIVQPKSPCRIRYQRRTVRPAHSAHATHSHSASISCPQPHRPAERFRIHVDTQLCQGHAMCMGEAPHLFKVDANNELQVLDSTPLMQNLEQAQQAVRNCPNQAIRIELNHHEGTPS